MSNRIHVIAAAAAAIAATLLTAPPASAEDQRPCVSLREYRGTHLKPMMTRREVEARWDVRDLGVRVAYDQWDYRACGYSMNEVSVSLMVEDRHNPRVSTLDLKVLVVVRARATVITVHGHP